LCIDFALVVDQFEEKIPCYVLYRLDDKTTQGYPWIFLCYVPDFARVLFFCNQKKEKIKTKSNFKKSLLS